jgi:hypothetical protein
MGAGIAALTAVVLYPVEVVGVPAWSAGPLPLPVPASAGVPHRVTDARARSSYFEPHLGPVLYGAPDRPVRWHLELTGATVGGITALAVELWRPPRPATDGTALAFVHYALREDPVAALASVTTVGVEPGHPTREAVNSVLAPAARLRAGLWRALSVSFVSFRRGPRRRMSARYRHWPADRQWLWSMASSTTEARYPPDPVDEAAFRGTVHLSTDWRALVLRDGAAFVGLGRHTPGRGEFLDFGAVLVPSVYADVFALGLAQRQALRDFAQDLALLRETGPAQLELTELEQRLARLRNTLWARRVNSGGVANALLEGFHRQNGMVELLQQIEHGLDRSTRLVQAESALRREVAVNVITTVGLPPGLVFAAGAMLAPGPRTFVVCLLLSLFLLVVLHLVPAVRDSTRAFLGIGFHFRRGWRRRRVGSRR